MPLKKSEFVAFLKNFLDLLYPDLCCACKNILMQGERQICLHCSSRLPFTGFEHEKENSFTALFWGRVPVETSVALFYYQKGGIIQNLIHSFKYSANIRMGCFLGDLLGESIARSNLYRNIEFIVPVPLHKEKERKRGFNQSKIIAGCISGKTNASCLNGVLERRGPTETQTRKARYARWENVSGSFGLTCSKAVKGRNILLVDDVVTTGATLEACANTLFDGGAARLWMAALAISI